MAAWTVAAPWLRGDLMERIPLSIHEFLNLPCPTFSNLCRGEGRLGYAELENYYFASFALNLSSLILVPLAAITNYHKLADLKQHKFFLYNSGD